MAKKQVKEKIVINYSTLNFYLLITLLLILAFGLYNVWQINKQIKLAQPPTYELTITTIAAPNCPDCVDISQLASVIKQTPNVKVTEEKTVQLEDAQELIEKHGIDRLPAVIVTGDVEEVSIQGLERSENALVFKQAPPPYYDTAQERVVGLVSVTLIKDKTCNECANLSSVVDQLEQVGVAVSEEQTLDVSEEDAQELISKYNITAVPTILMNEEALAYDIISQVWNAVGSVEDDNTLVLRQATPPYKDLQTGKTRGVVNVKFVVDETCDLCYNASLHEIILAQNFGMTIGEREFVDVNSFEGKRLVRKYNISLVPTIVLSEEAQVYPAVGQVWDQIGTQEEDGSFVFRQINKLSGATYKNLETKEVLNATG